MQVFKFGGTSINSYDRIKNLGWILQHHKDQKILIVISAMGKMTDTLEKISEEYFAGKQEEALILFDNVKNYHLNLLKYLVTFNWEMATKDLDIIIEETKEILQAPPAQSYDYYYDRIVGNGELLSSTLISYYLSENKLPNTLLNARNILKTDSTFRDAKVDWDLTKKKVSQMLLPLFDQTNFLIIQGFIGSDQENNPTTLGREGSDYTAAIFGRLLQAESVTIWKDVEGVMTGDPREIKDAVVLNNLHYKEVIEMAFYGAKVIHPKTIKPLQNENIPLFVKSFLEPQLPGTVISEKPSPGLPPIVVYKHGLALMVLESVDFTFVEGEPVSRLHTWLNELDMKPHLTQNTAISLLLCVDDIPEKIDQLARRCADLFRVHLQKNLLLLTVRHYTPEIIHNLAAKNPIVLEQKTAQTVQLLMETAHSNK